MGFSAQQAKKGLAASGNDVERAAAYLLDHPEGESSREERKKALTKASQTRVLPPLLLLLLLLLLIRTNRIFTMLSATAARSRFEARHGFWLVVVGMF